MIMTSIYTSKYTVTAMNKLVDIFSSMDQRVWYFFNVDPKWTNNGKREAIDPFWIRDLIRNQFCEALLSIYKNPIWRNIPNNLLNIPLLDNVYF